MRGLIPEPSEQADAKEQVACRCSRNVVARRGEAKNETALPRKALAKRFSAPVKDLSFSLVLPSAMFSEFGLGVGVQ